MTAVDHAELKRLEGELSRFARMERARAVGARKRPISVQDAPYHDACADTFERAVVVLSTHAALLSEIEGLKAELDEARAGRSIIAGGSMDMAVMYASANERADAAEAALRTEAPDSWRPTEQEVETVLRCCDAMERSVERKGLPKSEADICVATDWLRKVCAALRPQTAESGK